MIINATRRSSSSFARNFVTAFRWRSRPNQQQVLNNPVSDLKVSFTCRQTMPVVSALREGNAEGASGTSFGVEGQSQQLVPFLRHKKTPVASCNVEWGIAGAGINF